MKKLILFLSLVLSLFIIISPVFGQGSDLRVRNLYVYRGMDGRGGIPLWWDGFIYGQYAGTTRDCVFYNYTGSGQYLVRLQGDGANVFTIDKSGNVVAGGIISGAIAIPDTDSSNFLSLIWNEDDIADRTLNFLVSGGNRSLTLQNNLTVEAASLVNQDLTTDASPTFGGLTVNGNVGIDVAPTIGQVQLTRTNTNSPAGYQAGGFFRQDVNPTVNHVGNTSMYSLVGYGYVPIASSNTINRITGVEGWVENYGSGSVARLVGVTGWAYNDKNVTVTDIWGGNQVATSNDGTVSSLIGNRIFVSSFGGTVTDNIGLHIDDIMISGSTVTNRYGIKIDTFTGSASTLDFALHSSATQDSYFAGDIGIGTTDPLGTVDIVGASPAGTISTGTKNLLIQQESAITSSYTYNLLSEFDIDAPTNSSGLYFGGHFELGTVTGNSVNYTGDLTALQGQSEHFGTGDVSKAIGVFGAVINRSTGTIAEARAGVFRILDYSSGTITNAHTIYVDNYDGSATVVGKTGIMISDITGATNNTELLIGTPTIPTGDFAIYNTSTADSYFVGSLGMNTTGPDRRLDVLDASNPQLRLTHTDGTVFADFQVDGNHDLIIKPSSTGQTIFQPTTDSTDFFQVLDADGGTPILSVNSTNERVGIGIATPGGPLEVKTSGHTHIYLSGGAGYDSGFLLREDTATRWQFDYDASEDAIRFYNSVAPAGIRFLIKDGTGYVGISTTGPDRRLDVLDATNPQLRLTHTDGTIYTDFQTDGSGDLTIFPSGDEVDITQDATSTTLNISAYHNTEGTTPTITMRKADNTKASPAPVDSGAVLGTVYFNGYDDDSFDNGARIYAQADANWGAAERGTDLFFSTRDGAGALTDQLKITADGHIRAGSSEWYKTEHLGAIDLSPGGSGPDQVVPTSNTLGGYNLDDDGEYLYFTTHVHEDWDGASDILLDIHFECDVDNSGGLVGDDVEFDLLCYYKEAGETVNKTQTPTVVVVVGQSVRYKLFEATITIDYDLGGNVVDAGDIIAMRINFDASNSDIADVVLTHLTFKYQTTYVNEEI